MTSQPRRVVVLGSTGSIGRQAIEVIASHPDRFELVGIVAGSDGDALARQAAELKLSATGLGVDAAVAMATRADVDVVLNGVVGAAGLRASVAALDAGKTLALANKESLVAGGQACLAAAARGGGAIVPVDSEHAAIGQCLATRDRATVEKIILTASGGPFRTRENLADVTPDEALAHPTWSMGPKITIDSATLMNKGLEIIEAHWLFDLDYDDIDVVVHPQSAVHGIVQFVDGSALMQAAPTDMRIPIQAALTAPDLFESPVAPLDFDKIGALEFEPLDHERFPAVGLASQAGRAGRSHPAALNAANEVAVHAFLAGELAFTSITSVVADVLEGHEPVDVTDLDVVLEVDSWARAAAARAIGARA